MFSKATFTAICDISSVLLFCASARAAYGQDMAVRNPGDCPDASAVQSSPQFPSGENRRHAGSLYQTERCSGVSDLLDRSRH